MESMFPRGVNLASNPMIAENTIDQFPALVSSGPVFRKQTNGPELDLVYQYISTSLPEPGEDEKLTVFIEPKISSGNYPDIVAVYWKRSVTLSWPAERVLLTSADLRVLHSLYLSSTKHRDDLDSPALIDFNLPKKSRDRLQKSGLLLNNNMSWTIRPLREIFAVQKIIAIEAKIHDWQKGLDQALLNTWFSSESYLLLPRIPAAIDLVERAKNFGIGLVDTGTPLNKTEITARSYQIPASFTSWEFNEWAWRSQLREKDRCVRNQLINTG